MRKYIALLAAAVLCMTSQTAFSVTSNDYFPLKPGTVWRYMTDGGETVERIVLKKKVMVNGVETSVVNYVDENFRVYFSSGFDGIFLHRQYEPSVYVEGVGLINIDATFVEPIKFADATFDVGGISHSQGTAITRAAGQTFYFGYTANITVEAAENITVQGVNYDTIKVRMVLSLSSDFGEKMTITSIQNFAKDIGIVRDRSIDAEEGSEATEELVYTNANIYDLAITSISQPKRVTLSAGTPSKTSLLKIKLQNRGPFEETIEDAVMLTNLIAVTVDSSPYGACPAPTSVLRTGKPQKPFPIIVKPGKSLTIYYDVTFDCANNPTKGTPDYRFSAVIDRAALDGKEDVNPSDDVCPRDSTSPTDKGCGTKKPDRTLGGEILTDIIWK